MEKDKKELEDAQNWIETDWFKIWEDLTYNRFDKEKYDEEKKKNKEKQS